MLNIAAVGGIVMSLLAGPAIAGSTTQSGSTKAPPGHITVTVEAVNGSGCPQGSAVVAAAPGNTAFTVIYSQFTAQAGHGIPLEQNRRNCQMAVRVGYPQGFTFAIFAADYRGYADLSAGDHGSELASYYFQGMPETGQVEHALSGHLRADWQFSDVTPVASLVWAPCGARRDVNINAELRVDKHSAPTMPTMLTMDSTDASVKTLYHMQWKRC